MPKKLERKLARAAGAKGLTGRRRGAYIYGTMQKVTSWRPRRARRS